MSCGEQCISGSVHQGTTTGAISTINDIKAYIATPSNPVPHKAILIFPDVFGINLRNTQLIADKLAADSSVTTYLIDTFSGDCLPEPGKGNGITFLEWKKAHGPEKILPIIENAFKHLRDTGVQRFAAIGYCFGGKYVFVTAQKNWIQVGATCHPSLLEIPDDFKKLLATSQVPMLINSCEIDENFPKESQSMADEVLGNGNYRPGYKQNYYPGASHGFGCRANLDNVAEKKAFDESYAETVKWFKTYL